MDRYLQVVYGNDLTGKALRMDKGKIKIIVPLLVALAAAIAGVFPLAGLIALVYRFPFPLAGYYGGWDAASGVHKAVLFYLMFGGYVLVAIVGVAAGLGAWRLSRGNRSHAVGLAVALALLGDLMLVLTLSVWDKVYGPW